jgi:hypothetical protein
MRKGMDPGWLVAGCNGNTRVSSVSETYAPDVGEVSECRPVEDVERCNREECVSDDSFGRGDLDDASIPVQFLRVSGCDASACRIPSP